MSKSVKRHQRTLGTVTRSAIEGAAGVNSNSFYDCKSGLSICVILALTIAWIPYIGPMVAGFVGGRRAGSISRGLLIGVAGSTIVFIIALLLNLGLVKLLEPDYQSFIDTMNAISPNIVLGIEGLSAYLSNNFVTVTSGLSVSLAYQTFAAIIGFAIIGGVFADQSRKELRIIVSQSMNVNRPRPARSTAAFVAGHDMGFQTYDDLNRLSVNAVGEGAVHTNVPVADVRAPIEPVSTEPAKVELAVPDVVTTNVVTTKASVTPTETVPDVQESKEIPTKEPEPAKPVTSERPITSDDMEWF